MFQHRPQELAALAERILATAKRLGADAAEADISEAVGLNVQVRRQDIDQIEHQQDKSLDITVYAGQSKGRASTADFSDAAVASAVQAALDIARYTAQDDCAGLADAGLMADAADIFDLDKYHEWPLDSAAAVELAQRCEAAALACGRGVKHSEGASVQTGHYQYVYANSHGFVQHQQSTRHSLSCSMVAEDAQGMERDYWYDSQCDAADLEAAETVGRTAAERSVRRLGGGSLKTGSYPVLFDATVSGSLIGHLIGALSGAALYRQNSFLLGSLGQQIFPEWFNLYEDPHLPRRAGSSCFDAEGVATRPRHVIENGTVQGYFLSSYSARKLKMTTTGNAGGAHNLLLRPSHPDQAALLREMGSGLLVTELMGQGVNILTGDYSRGAAGFWVENGLISRPVSEITIAGRLQDLFLSVAGVADDALRRNTHSIGSILFERMTVAGS